MTTRIQINRGTEIVQQSTGIIREATGTFFANATLDQDSGCMLFTLPIVGLCYVMEDWAEVRRDTAMEKTINAVYQISGKRKKLVGYVGELRDGDMLIHSMEYSTHSQAERALDALAFEILSDQFEHGLVDAPPFDLSTCCFCGKPHAAQSCPEMRAMLFAPEAPIYPPLDCPHGDDCPWCARGIAIADHYLISSEMIAAPLDEVV